ncbi:hypothetical protein CHUAL_009049 [Chamberlinius hualienensis]
MVLNFRVSELQVLLGFAGRSKTGRKDELQNRALELIKLKSAPVQMKIRELHKRYPPANRSRETEGQPGGRSHHSIHSASPPLQKSDMSSHHGMITRSLAPLSSGPSLVQTPLDYSSKYGHHNASASLPVLPDVKFKKLPFFEVLAELLKPATLVPNGGARYPDANFVFHLTPQQASDISMSRDLRPNAKLEYQTQIQMRFCLLETTCEQDDYFPPNISVKINGKQCPLPNPIPTNKPGVEPKRPSRPVNITALAKLSPIVPNHVNVTWVSEYGRGYAIGIFLVRRLSANQLLQKLKTKGIRNADHTRALIKEKLTQEADSEIATTSLRVSLLCPLGKRRMQWPCRAVSCMHLQCFDASLYVQMNEKKPTWICPVCDKPASFDNLVIDGLFTEIFNATDDCTEIQFFDDGSWSPLVARKEAHTIGSPVHKGLSSGNAVTWSGGSNSNQSVASVSSSDSRTTTSSSKEKSKVELIDLTIESSDEDEPPKKKAATVSHFQSTYLSEITAQSVNNNTLRPVQPTATATIPSYISTRPSSSNSLPIGHGHTPRVNMLSNCSSNSMYRDMPVVESNPSLYYPLSCSPYQDLIQSPHSALYNFPGYEIFSLLGQGEDRQNMPYTMNSGLSLSNSSALSGSHKATQPSASPDVISLD